MKARLLALFDAAVATKESGGLQDRAEIRIHEHECAADTKANGVALSDFAAAFDECFDVDFLDEIGQTKRRESILRVRGKEVFADLIIIQQDFAIAFLKQTYACNRALALAKAVVEGAGGCHRRD